LLAELQEVSMADRTRPSSETRESERKEASRAHVADREPTPDELHLADALPLDPDVADYEEEMLERGAHQKGEGRIP